VVTRRAAPAPAQSADEQPADAAAEEVGETDIEVGGDATSKPATNPSQ
jgi:hypothetical protein